MTVYRWIEIGTLGSLAGIFAIFPVYTPQGVDYFAVTFLLLGSLLIEQRDIDGADWTGRRPFVFACSAVILAVPFVSGVFSVNGFNSQIGSGVYLTAAPPALFLVASKARFHLVGPGTVKRLILAAVFIGLVPAAIYALSTTSRPPREFSLPGQPAFNIVAVYISCAIAITLILMTGLSRRSRILGYVAVLALLALGWMTASRTFVASIAIVFGVYALGIRRHKMLRRELFAFIGVAAVTVAVSLWAFRRVLVRILRHQPSDFFDGRLQSWADAWELFRRYPLFGIGPSTFYNISLNPLYIERTQHHIKYHAYYHAHDIFLNTLAEGGLLLGVLLLALIAAAIYGCYLILRDNPENPFGQIAVTLVLIFLVVGLFENTIIRPVIFPLAIFLGLGMNVTWNDPPRASNPD